jgi:ESF2/ABP1 family protein
VEDGEKKKSPLKSPPRGRERVKKKKKSKLIPGVVYLSRIPPYMRPQKLKYLLSPYGRVKNVFLQPEGMG